MNYEEIIKQSTPRPWAQRTGENSEFVKWSKIVCPAMDNLFSSPGGMPYNNRLADDAFTVLAVNSHEALVDAISKLLDVTYTTAIEEGNTDVRDARISAQIALTRAKGGKP